MDASIYGHDIKVWYDRSQKLWTGIISKDGLELEAEYHHDRDALLLILGAMVEGLNHE